MRSRFIRHIVVAVGFAGIAGAQSTNSNRPTQNKDKGIVPEARSFMTAYAIDLRTGNRESIIARYDRDGAYFVGHGHKELATLDSIGVKYRSDWSPPTSFEWKDLSYEPIGQDAVVVTGTFEWGTSGGGRPLLVSYTGLLRRRAGKLRIRLEDESAELSGRASADSTRR